MSTGDLIIEKLKKPVKELEEAEYRSQRRIRLVPPHLVLINPENQKQYDQLLRKYRREQVIRGSFLTIPNGQVSDNLLEEINEQVFQKPWDKLALEYQINRLFVFLNEFAERNNLSQSDFVNLRKKLVNATFRKELTGDRIVYDVFEGQIKEIREHAIETMNTNKIVSVDKIISENGNKLTIGSVTQDSLHESRPIVQEVIFHKIKKNKSLLDKPKLKAPLFRKKTSEQK